jgi:hypothetical protein
LPGGQPNTAALRQSGEFEEGDPMSLQAIEQILERGAREPQFADAIKKDPKVLDQYDLTADERSAILSRDMDKLESLGMEERVTKSLFRGKSWA